MIEHLCDCGRTYKRFNSLQRRCPICSYNRDKKPSKPLKRMGKVANEWGETRAEWIKEHPGPWKCQVGGALLDDKHMNLDHNFSRARRPDLRFDLLNLGPLCGFHNKDKGSLGLQEYIDTNPDKKCRNY